MMLESFSPLIFRSGLVAAVLLTIGLSSCGPSPEPVSLKRATAADIIQQVSEYKGREAVLVNFWATWCAPCVQEFPMIVELGRRYRDEGLKIYFVSVDWLEQSDRVRTFLEQQGVEGLSFIKDEKDNPFIDGIARDWTGAVPFTIVYAKRSGAAMELWEGKAHRERFENAIEMALEN
ncbi:MAG: TlpA family protein disulfide reductase [Fidelibacterota bacterium]|nr:MAG: TlpA family protein disulfide reductase [Candidatus Neomarinimicrobiota bacterium]